jgi:thioredoxin 1
MAGKTFTDSNFQQEVLGSKTPVVVDFWAEWCTPCRMVSPIIDELAKDYEGKMIVGKLDVDANQQASGQFNVMSIPTVMVFKDGKPVKSIIGAQGKESYKKAFEEALAS